MDRKALRIPAMSIPVLAVGIGMVLFQNGWLAIGLYHAGMILFLVLDSHCPPVRNILSGWNKKWTWLILVCLLPGLAIYLLWPWMKQPSDINRLLSNYRLSESRWIAYVIYYSLFHPVLEEFYWRGYLGHPSKHLRVEDVAFAGYHFFTMLCFVEWPWALLTFVILAGAAWLWRQSARDSNGLLIPTITHMAAAVSISVMVSILLLSS